MTEPTSTTPDPATALEDAGPGAEPRPVIVVGVSQTSHSPTAVRWAAAEAERTGAELLAVRAWRPSHPPAAASGRPPVVSRDTEAERSYAVARLEADVEDVLGPDHGARCELHDGTALSVLQWLSESALLLVLDAPRRTDLKTTPMLAHRLVYAAACPVVIMPPRISGQPESALSRVGRRAGEEIGRTLAAAGRPGVRPPNMPGPGPSPD
ncbi:hypothetical protein FHX74_000902 [Friedmanniella endophytica]|uniref:UspA domain-containing protein n=1 Tax=Microlunatus kandeliicorticis TaxID=1759536 RepID=A0A7W3IQC7_9ACTN|nr:universal stress protein [Microlunatus kandeliicorticis]MBA8793308.1 hypothetical protein [Microlunatus kandeliicorticis]